MVPAAGRADASPEPWATVRAAGVEAATSWRPGRRICEALSSVYDTCSLLDGTRLDIVEMGLVHDIEQDQGHVRIRLPLDRSRCACTCSRRSQIIDVLSALPGVESPSRSSRFQGTVMAGADDTEARERLERRPPPGSHSWTDAGQLDLTLPDHRDRPELPPVTARGCTWSVLRVYKSDQSLPKRAKKGIAVS